MQAAACMANTRCQYAGNWGMQNGNSSREMTDSGSSACGQRAVNSNGQCHLLEGNVIVVGPSRRHFHSEIVRLVHPGSSRSRARTIAAAAEELHALRDNFRARPFAAAVLGFPLTRGKPSF